MKPVDQQNCEINCHVQGDRSAQAQETFHRLLLTEKLVQFAIISTIFLKLPVNLPVSLECRTTVDEHGIFPSVLFFRSRLDFRLVSSGGKKLG